MKTIDSPEFLKLLQWRDDTDEEDEAGYKALVAYIDARTGYTIGEIIAACVKAKLGPLEANSLVVTLKTGNPPQGK